MAAPYVEDVEMSGHIIDSLLLPKVLDAILTRGAGYEIKDFRVHQEEPHALEHDVSHDPAPTLHP